VGLPQNTRLEVQKLFELGITKPNAILKALEGQQHLLPKKAQLTNYLKTIRLRYLLIEIIHEVIETNS